MSDINNTKRILKVGGIMILDDILHKGVREAITEVLKYDKNYAQIFVKYKHKKKRTSHSHDKLNPATMSAYIKLK